MKKYVKNYLSAMGLNPEDTIYSEVSGAVATDIHHIKFKSQGGTDEAENLIALTRKEHAQAHFISEPYLKSDYLLKIHFSKLYPDEEMKDYGTDPF